MLAATRSQRGRHHQITHRRPSGSEPDAVDPLRNCRARARSIPCCIISATRARGLERLTADLARRGGADVRQRMDSEHDARNEFAAGPKSGVSLLAPDEAGYPPLARNCSTTRRP